MNAMKRFRPITFIVLPLLSFSITSCDPASSTLEYNELNEDVVSVDLIDYKNENQKSFTSWVPDHESDLVPFVVENATIIKSLDNNVIDTFVQKVCSYTLLVKYYAYDSPKGVCIRMNHKNEDFTILWAPANSFRGYIGKFSPNGDVKEYYGCYEGNYIDNLLENYFNYPEVAEY